MKTIQQIAEGIGVSKATVYNRLKACQIRLTDLTGKKEKNKRLFDEKAEAIIKGLFEKDLSNNDEPSRQSKQSDELVKELERTRADLAEAQAEILRLRELEELQQKQIADLIEIQKADKMLLLQQQSSIKMLEAPKSQIGLIARARRFIFGEKKEGSL